MYIALFSPGGPDSAIAAAAQQFRQNNAALGISVEVFRSLEALCSWLRADPEGCLALLAEPDGCEEFFPALHTLQAAGVCVHTVLFSDSLSGTVEAFRLQVKDYLLTPYREEPTLRALEHALALRQGAGSAKPASARGFEANSFTRSYQDQLKFLERMPIAIALLRVEENAPGFTFVYVNQKLCELLNLPADRLTGADFYTLCPDGDPRWLQDFRKTAFEGLYQKLQRYSPEVGKTLVLSCYQPMKGYCACLVQTVENETPAP